MYFLVASTVAPRRDCRDLIEGDQRAVGAHEHSGVLRRVEQRPDSLFAGLGRFGRESARHVPRNAEQRRPAVPLPARDAVSTGIRRPRLVRIGSGQSWARPATRASMIRWASARSSADAASPPASPPSARCVAQPLERRSVSSLDHVARCVEDEDHVVDAAEERPAGSGCSLEGPRERGAAREPGRLAPRWFPDTVLLHRCDPVELSGADIQASDHAPIEKDGIMPKLRSRSDRRTGFRPTTR